MSEQTKTYETEVAALRQEFERDILPKIRDRANEIAIGVIFREDAGASIGAVLTDIAWTTFKLSRAIMEIAMKQCPSCCGTGQWGTACCNGADGCDCHGQLVPMGQCNVCHGTGEIRADGVGVNLRANLEAIAGSRREDIGPESRSHD